MAEELGVACDVVKYLKDKPDRATLEWIVAHLVDPVEDLVRKDSLFKKLELDPTDFSTPEAVVTLLLQRPALMQRPVVVKGDTAIIGRPKERIRELLVG